MPPNCRRICANYAGAGQNAASAPPALFDMGLFFCFGRFFNLIAGIPHDSVKNSAAGIFPVRVALIGQLQHGFYKS